MKVLVSQVPRQVQRALFAKVDLQELHMPKPAHLYPWTLNSGLPAWLDVCTDTDSSLHMLLSFHPPSAQISYLCLEAFDQNGNKKVEEHVIAKGHQGHKVECCPRGRRCHPVVQDHIPVLLSEDLQRRERENSLNYSTPFVHSSCKYRLINIILSFWPFLSTVISRSHENRPQNIPLCRCLHVRAFSWPNLPLSRQTWHNGAHRDDQFRS